MQCTKPSATIPIPAMPSKSPCSLGTYILKVRGSAPAAGRKVIIDSTWPGGRFRKLKLSKLFFVHSSQVLFVGFKVFHGVFSSIHELHDNHIFEITQKRMERLKVTYLNLTRSCLHKVQPTKTKQNMEVEHEPFAEVHSLKLAFALKIGHPKRKLIFQPSFSGALPLVSGRVFINHLFLFMCELSKWQRSTTVCSFQSYQKRQIMVWK